MGRFTVKLTAFKVQEPLSCLDHFSDAGLNLCSLFCVVYSYTGPPIISASAHKAGSCPWSEINLHFKAKQNKPIRGAGNPVPGWGGDISRSLAQGSLCMWGWGCCCLKVTREETGMEDFIWRLQETETQWPASDSGQLLAQGKVGSSPSLSHAAAGGKLPRL